MALRPRGGDRDAAGDLWQELVDVLLLGWGCEVRPEHLDDRPFDVFLLTEQEMAEAWRTHRARLMAEAKRRGIAQPWATRYDAEEPPAARRDTRSNDDGELVCVN